MSGAGAGTVRLNHDHIQEALEIYLRRLDQLAGVTNQDSEIAAVGDVVTFMHNAFPDLRHGARLNPLRHVRNRLIDERVRQDLKEGAGRHSVSIGEQKARCLILACEAFLLEHAPTSRRGRNLAKSEIRVFLSEACAQVGYEVLPWPELRKWFARQKKPSELGDHAALSPHWVRDQIRAGLQDAASKSPDLDRHAVVAHNIERLIPQFVRKETNE